MARNMTLTMSMPNLPGMVPDRNSWVYVSPELFFLALLSNTQIINAFLYYIHRKLVLREKKRASRKLLRALEQQVQVGLGLLKASLSSIRASNNRTAMLIFTRQPCNKMQQIGLVTRMAIIIQKWDQALLNKQVSVVQLPSSRGSISILNNRSMLVHIAGQPLARYRYSFNWTNRLLASMLTFFKTGIGIEMARWETLNSRRRFVVSSPFNII